MIVSGITVVSVLVSAYETGVGNTLLTALVHDVYERYFSISITTAYAPPLRTTLLYDLVCIPIIAVSSLISFLAIVGPRMQVLVLHPIINTYSLLFKGLLPF